MLIPAHGALLAALVVLITVGAGCRNAPAPRRDGRATLAAVGDVLLTRGVGKQIQKRGLDDLLEKTRSIIAGADIAFLNLECTLSTRGLPQRRKFRFRAEPALAGTLSGNGFDVACLANNHTLDFGRDAMLDTIKAVEAAGMTSIGAGRNGVDALRVRIVVKNGLRVGFVGYTDLPTYGVVRLQDRPTIAGANADEIPEQIRLAKTQCDVLVISFHWGVEYMKRPTRRQRMLARQCIDNGADLILGHHPHVLQTIEVYKGRPIVYSMGGFIWDSKVFGSDESAIYLFDLGRSSARLVKAIPLDIVNCQPRPVPMPAVNQ